MSIDGTSDSETLHGQQEVIPTGWLVFRELASLDTWISADGTARPMSGEQMSGGHVGAMDRSAHASKRSAL